jgi:threonine synthase
MITLATAHPAKFPDAVEAATGMLPVLPRWLADLFDRPERFTDMPNNLQKMKSLIRERIAP